MMSSRNKLFLKAPLTFQCNEEEDLPVGNSSLLTVSERVSWDPGPHKRAMICSGEGTNSLSCDLMFAASDKKLQMDNRRNEERS